MPLPHAKDWTPWPHLGPASQDRLSTNATISILDYCSLFGRPFDFMAGEMTTPILLARSISSPRALASLLSHPGCVLEPRQWLLQRFEELVLYDGKPVLLKPEEPEGPQPAHDQTPPRRFHNLHDAAAWIQQNWPDFDLETNCPVTWRGSR